MAEKLHARHCTPCQGGATPLSPAAARRLMKALHPDWELTGRTIRRRLAFKGFARAVYHANLAAWLGDSQGHHPDIRFGWGYCEVVFTTHDAGGLTENDFICAARFDRLIG